MLSHRAPNSSAAQTSASEQKAEAKDSSASTNGAPHVSNGSQGQPGAESKSSNGAGSGADSAGAGEAATTEEAGSAQAEGGAAAKKPLSRVIVRRESTPGGIGTKLLLNVAVFKDMVVEKVHEKAIKFSCISVGGTVEVYLATVRAARVLACVCGSDVGTVCRACGARIR